MTYPMRSEDLDRRKLPRVAIAQLGARRHYLVPAALAQRGLLERLYTDTCANVGWPRLVARCIPAPLRPAPIRRLLARRVPDVPNSKIMALGSFGLSRVWSRSRTQTEGQLFAARVSANSRFCKLVAGKGLDAADTLYVFNGAGLELLQHARRWGLRTIVDQTAAPVAVEQRLISEERARWPGWEAADTVADNWAAMAAREAAEWELADLIVCGSDYVRDALVDQSVVLNRCSVVPYGTRGGNQPDSARSFGHGQLRILYVGSVCLRKGAGYLMEAARRLRSESIKFRMVGPVQVSHAATRELRRWLDLAGPVPRSEMRREYEQADLLVLPTVSEGSANACYEALSAGLPVITTPNAGSVVRDARDGFIVPVRDVETLVNRITTLACDRDLLRLLSKSALERSSQFTWEHYAGRLEAAIGGDESQRAGQPVASIDA